MLEWISYTKTCIHRNGLTRYFPIVCKQYEKSHGATGKRTTPIIRGCELPSIFLFYFSAFLFWLLVFFFRLLVYCRYRFVRLQMHWVIIIIVWLGKRKMRQNVIFLSLWLQPGQIVAACCGDIRYGSDYLSWLDWARNYIVCGSCGLSLVGVCHRFAAQILRQFNNMRGLVLEIV